ncbi:BTAD domain-containing putative transcriptional regulator [Streptomyces sp. SAI-041]|uniref:AfsR/SARP family transcriptional regulator n=1 Tax=Streptomyces sp. SAI-041 TaxID=2940548 RepID=UPI002476607A|nr:BTAD domain-containing putative transcriptional regulator [Streptomyces sp. SAI-041]MDH6546380.1 putative ATPase/DNA-binding SARP family transcriptional activator [Streptomyces sp. SAI-041]
MDGEARLRIAVLGTFRTSRGETVVPVPGARLQHLVVRLALAGGAPVGQRTLIEAIWPEDAPADPAHALQALVSRLRKALGSASAVVQAAGGYRLAVDAQDVDALRFEHLTAAGRERLRARDWHSTAARLREAITLWSGPLGAPPGVVAAVEPAAATRLAHASLDAVADLAEAELSLGAAVPAADRLNGLLSEQPLHERALALLMDALAVQGREGEALTRYEHFRRHLADSFGTDPGAALRERHLRLLRAQQEPEPTAFAARTKAPGHLSNLPAALTSFIGRDDDLARIDTLFASGRLVTVLGPGGAGKTRLAIESARRRQRAYRDGAWLVDLASVTEPGKVGAAVLAAIGMRGSAFLDAGGPRERFSDNAGPRDRFPGAGAPNGAGGPRAQFSAEVDAVADQLDGLEILLVLDNCEHVIDTAAHLTSALLRRCVGLRVLATSREPLAIDGETLVPLGPLAVPGTDTDLDEIRHVPSVRLFTERAAAVRPGFDVNESNHADVLRIVRDLDGLPLALELAAARLRTLSLTDLATGLTDRFELLATGSRTASARHRTLRAVIAWSWDLLDEEARTVAERVAVLPGGVTPASAAAVCAGTAVPVRAVPDLLAALVDRSLLQLAPDSGRYRMLETIRQYGLERLAAHQPPADVQDLAAQYLADLVAHHDPLTRGPRQIEALRTLSSEHDNVIAALRHLCDSEAADKAIALTLDLTWYWQIQSRHEDAAYWLAQAVALPGERSGGRYDIARAMLHFNAHTGQGSSFKDLLAESEPDLREITGRLLSCPQHSVFTGALAAVGLALSNETAESEALLQSFLDGPDTWLAGYTRISRAHACENRGDLDQAREDVAAALGCFTQAGDHWAVAMALPLRSLLHQYDGELSEALADLQEAQRLAEQFGALSLGDEIFLALRQFDLLIRLQRTAEATDLLAATRRHALRSTSPEMAVLLDARESSLHLQLGDLDRAGRLIDAAEARMREPASHGGEHGHALIATVRGEFCLRNADAPAAAHALHTAYAAAMRSRDLPLVATVAVAVAGLAELYARPHDVATLLGAAARLRGAHDLTDPHIRALRTRTQAILGETDFSTAYSGAWQLDVPAALARVDPALLCR